MAVELDVGLYAAAQFTDQFVHLPGRGHADRVSDTDPIHADGVHGLVDAKQILRVAPKRVFGAETHFHSLIAHVGHDLQGYVDDLLDILPVAKLAQHRRGADHYIYAIHAGVEGSRCVVHPAADVGNDFGLEANLGNGHHIPEALR